MNEIAKMTCMRLCVAGLVALILLAKTKRATHGVYSPSRQEMIGSRIEIGRVLKPPPEERLI